MALRAIDNSDHNRLLQRLNNLPEERAEEYQTMLNRLFDEYQALLVDLSTIIQKYRVVAAKINERQPLVKRKEPQQPLESWH